MNRRSDLEHRPPPLRRLIREVFDLPRVFAAPYLPVVATQASGNRVPVLVIPGFTDSDRGTSRLVRSLDAAGYAAFGWGLGVNLGLRPGLVDRLPARLETIASSSEQKVVLLGWSLGGIYARKAAKLRPDIVRLVMTLGSPFSGSRKNNNAWRLYEAINDHSVDKLPVASELAEKPPVSTFAVWSPVDGIVASGAAHGQVGETDKAIELHSTHMGMGSRSRSIRQIIHLLDELVVGGLGAEPIPSR